MVTAKAHEQVVIHCSQQAENTFFVFVLLKKFGQQEWVHHRNIRL